MKQGRTLLLIDSIINFFLGIVLLAYSEPVVDFFGLPETEPGFYPNILGAILFGIGIALLIEYVRKDDFIGLGLGGAISINLMGGIVLFIWLVTGNMNLPLRGKIILWVLDIILFGISLFELIVYIKKKRAAAKALSIIGISLLLFSCEKIEDVDFKQEMRDFVMGISEYSKSLRPGFFVIPQNGIELVTVTGDEDGQPHSEYLDAIDGNGQEDLFYGYDKDDKATPDRDNDYLRTFLNISQNSGNIILVTDYCSTYSKMDESYNMNNQNGYVSFSADHRELDNIPSFPNPVYSENNNPISALSQIQNFLYLINPEYYTTKSGFINAVTSTNYDLLIMDLFFHDGTEFTSTETTRLRSKSNGGSRLVIAYMSIGEAEDYRYYWQTDWNSNEPPWMDKENPNWEGNFKVKYWHDDWQSIIYGNDNSYLKKVLDAGFDGVYLDIIDAFQYYE